MVSIDVAFDLFKHTFRSAGSHDKWRIVSTKLLHASIADCVTNFRKYTRDHGLQCLFLIASRFIFQFAFLSQSNKIDACVVSLFHQIILCL